VTTSVSAESAGPVKVPNKTKAKVNFFNVYSADQETHHVVAHRHHHAPEDDGRTELMSNPKTPARLFPQRAELS
jgi:hypothetical protein